MRTLDVHERTPRCPTQTSEEQLMIRAALWLAIDAAQLLLDAMKIAAADR